MDWYYMAIDGEHEYCDGLNGVVNCRTGDLLVVFLDTMWDAFATKTVQMKQERGDERELSDRFAEWYLDFKKDMDSKHPLLGVFAKDVLYNKMCRIIDQTYEGLSGTAGKFVLALNRGYVEGVLPTEIRRNVLQEISEALMQFEWIKKDFKSLAEAVLDAGENPNELSCVQRYRLSHLCSDAFSVLGYKYRGIDEELRLIVNGRSVSSVSGIDSVTIAERVGQVRGEKLALRYYKKSELLGPVLLYESYQMICQNIAIRKCEHCHRYFLPRSVVSRYCDRMSPDRRDMTCKKIGAKTAHNQSLVNDVAKGLLSKVKNRHRNYVYRNKSNKTGVKDKYDEWSRLADELFDRVTEGELTYERFSGLIDVLTDVAFSKEKMDEVKSALKGCSAQDGESSQQQGT